MSNKICLSIVCAQLHPGTLGSPTPRCTVVLVPEILPTGSLRTCTPSPPTYFPRLAHGNADSELEIGRNPIRHVGPGRVVFKPIRSFDITCPSKRHTLAWQQYLQNGTPFSRFQNKLYADVCRANFNIGQLKIILNGKIFGKYNLL